MRRVLLFIAIFCSSQLAVAQDFYYLNGSTLDEAGLVGGASTSTLQFLKNQAGDPITFKWEVLSVDTNTSSSGASVNFGVCDNVNCFGNFMGVEFTMDPVSGTSDYGQFKLQAFSVTGDLKTIVRIKVWDSNNPTAVDTVVMSWRTDNWIGLGELKKSTEISVFPNPASDKLKVSYNLPEQGGNFEIVSVLGNRVYQKNLTERKGELDLNVSRLAKGVYFYTVKSNTGKVWATRKLVVQ